MFVHTNKKYLERSMYLISDPYKFTAPILPMQAFIAPSDFNADAQEINIVKVFSAYVLINTNAKYIFSVSPAVTNTTLDYVSGRSYFYSENGGTLKSVASGTLIWIGGSNKRYVIVVDTNTFIQAILPFGTVWVYLGKKAVSIAYTMNNTTLKYIHGEDFSGITSIDSRAFQGCLGLTGLLTIPVNVTSIGIYAFYNCVGLTGTLVIPSKVVNITDCAFQYTGFTGALIFPSSLQTLGSGVFNGCAGLTGNITLSDNITSVGNGCFQDCAGLTGILSIGVGIIANGLGMSMVTSSGFSSIIGAGNANYSIINGIIYLKSGGVETVCIGVSVRSTSGILTIPSTVTVIGAAAFAGNASISGTLILPNSLVTIGGSAFVNCTGLTGSLLIPNSVTEVGTYGFYGCTGFNGTLTIGSKVFAVYDRAFQNCTHFTKISIMSSTLAIGGTAFAFCSSVIRIESISPTPLTVGDNNSFLGIDRNDCIVHVPYGTALAYRSAYQWSTFVNIVDDL